MEAQPGPAPCRPLHPALRLPHSSNAPHPSYPCSRLHPALLPGPQELECDSSLVFWDAASRSDSLRGLLQRKLVAAREGRDGDGNGGAAAGPGGRRGLERWGGARRGRQQQQSYGGRLVGVPTSSPSSPSGGGWSSGGSGAWSSSAGRYMGDQGDDLQDWLGQEL